MNNLTKEALKLKGPHPLKNQYKKTLKLSAVQKSILVGTLLGDGHLEARGKQTAYRYYFSQKLSQQVYVEYIHNYFIDWCSKEPANSKTGMDTKGEITNSCYFRTCTHNSLNFYGNQFYPLGGKKVVPKLLHKWLTPLALAHWYMDDGATLRNYGYILNTQSFSLKEQEILADALGRKFHLEVNIHKDRSNYRLYITAKSKDAFTEIIKPFIIPSFEYKLLQKS
jgi:hypothetical protein